eukprot:1160919-Pelagomonas_calceolata.AAC.13
MNIYVLLCLAAALWACCSTELRPQGSSSVLQAALLGFQNALLGAVDEEAAKEHASPAARQVFSRWTFGENQSAAGSASNGACSWPGITCSRDGSRVIKLDLQGLALSGALPSAESFSWHERQAFNFLRVLNPGMICSSRVVQPLTLAAICLSSYMEHLTLLSQNSALSASDIMVVGPEKNEESTVWLLPQGLGVTAGVSCCKSVLQVHAE